MAGVASAPTDRAGHARLVGQATIVHSGLAQDFSHEVQQRAGTMIICYDSKITLLYVIIDTANLRESYRTIDSLGADVPIVIRSVQRQITNRGL
jgi:hypothetical protein